MIPTLARPPRIMGAESPPIRRSAVVGWHFDFLVRCGAISNGQTRDNIELNIPPGAPFCLRGIGGYNVAAGPVVAALTGGFLQFTDSRDAWLQSQSIGISGDWARGGQNGLYEPVYEQIVYGPGSTMRIRLTNSSGGDWADARLVFRGTKLYYKDVLAPRSYPPCWRGFPYDQSLTFTVGANTTLPEQPLIINGTDFVFRGAEIDSTSGSMADLEIQIATQDQKPYSNDFIHHLWLFPTQLSQRPGVFYPEIYLPKDKVLLFNLQNNAAGSVTFNLNCQGARIFPQ